MKLIIFGSTGGTGQHLVQQALDQSHDVTAFARNPDNIGLQHPRLQVIKGDVLNLSDVEHAMQGQEAVICALGMPNILDKSQLRAKGTKNIISAMQKTGVKRLVCQSGLGAGDSRKLLPFHYKYLIAPLFMRALYADHNLQETYILQSDLNWVIARPGALNNGPLTGSYHEGYSAQNKPATIRISRADTADFMLKQIDSDRYLCRTACISY